MKKRKKILLCITKSAAGGAQKYVCDLATHLPADQFEIVIVAGGSGPLFSFAHNQNIRALAIPELGRDIHLLHEIKTFLRLISLFIKEKPDIIHLNSSKMGVLGAIAAWIAKCLTINFNSRVVFTVHGWGFREDRSMKQRMAIFAASWIAARFHHRAITINSSDHHDAKRFIPYKGISYIPLGITPAILVSRQDARMFFMNQSGLPIADNTIVIGVIAELVKNKGLTYFIDAIHHLISSSKQLRICCIIMGEGEERNSLTRQINNLDLGEHISLIGFIPQANQYLSGCDLFVLPSIKEGLPYALMEAMTAGLPVIACRVGGIPDLVSHHINGLLAPKKNAMAIANHMRDLIFSPKQREQFSTAAQTTIAKHFSLESMVANTIRLYHELV